MTGNMPLSPPKLSQYGPAFAWLLRRGASANHLAGVFGTTPENVRVISFRGRHESSLLNSDPILLDEPSSNELAGGLGIRPETDDVVRTPARMRKLDWLRNEIDRIVVQYAGSYQFFDGVAALRKLLPHIGYAADARRVAISGLMHQHISWFLVHRGRSASAAEEARIAGALWRRAYHESSLKDYAEGFIKSALISSHAHLLTRRPNDAWRILDMAADAAQCVNAPLGSDHFRQRGVALFQLREDDRAGTAVSDRQRGDGETRGSAQFGPVAYDRGQAHERAG